MTYPTHEGDDQISVADSVALRNEIADRLGASLDRKPVQLTQRLMVLMERLHAVPSDIDPDMNP